MCPILFVGAVGTAIAIERYVTLTRLSVKNRRAWQQVEPALTEGDFDKAREVTGKDDTAVARLLSVGLARQGAVRRVDDVEKAMRANLMELMPQSREAHALSRDVREPRDAARPARHGERSDPRLHGGRDREPGGEGEPARREHLRSDELYGVRPDGRRAVAVPARVPADEDQRADRAVWRLPRSSS